ncbi:MAG: hypothetical protein F4Y01_10055 [Gammaproteobacteria bacterium]|nr:hypothetical protein [Gammaproteobacteria bacterium]
MDEHDNLGCAILQWCRALGLFLALAVASPVLADAASENRCDELAEPQRAHCEKVLDCMAIDDADVRRVCLEEAKRQSERPLARPAQQVATPGEPPALVEETLGTPPPRSRPQQAPLSPPPDRFHAEVTGIHQSILDRQVIALDNRYLFEGEHARRARLKQGQEVEVRRMKSRFGSGRNWRITGPARSPVEVLRIRCERDDIGSDDRRRCERMLDR